MRRLRQQLVNQRLQLQRSPARQGGLQLAGRRIDAPPWQQVDVTFKKAPRAKGRRGCSRSSAYASQREEQSGYARARSTAALSGERCLYRGGTTVMGGGMLTTRGAGKKAKQFKWWFEPHLKMVRIENENRRRHSYCVEDIRAILGRLDHDFGGEWFPLANNVALMGKRKEKMGLGRAILEQGESSVCHAQGASYLGVVLEECGYLVWNGIPKGIEWRIDKPHSDPEKLASRLGNPPYKGLCTKGRE